jgi:hypothetical protein
MDQTQALLEKLGNIDSSGFAALAEVLQAAAGHVPVMKEMTALEYSEHLVAEVDKFNAEEDAGRKATRLQRIQQSMAAVEKFKGADRVSIPVFTDAGLPTVSSTVPAVPSPAAPAGQPSADPTKPGEADGAVKAGDQPADGSSAAGKTLGQRLDEALTNMEREIAGLNVAAALSTSAQPASDGAKPPATVAGGEGDPGKADPPSEGDNAGDGSGTGGDAGDGDGAGDAGNGESGGDGAGDSEGDDDAASASAPADEWPADLNDPTPADDLGKDPAATA